MKADPRWAVMPPAFWHNVRVISELLGYSKKKIILNHSKADILGAFSRLDICDLDEREFVSKGFDLDSLVEYFQFRAELIEGPIAENLQTVVEARDLFARVAAEYTDGYVAQHKGGKENARDYRLKSGRIIRVPYNKQKGEKYDLDFLTGTSNILLAHFLGDLPFDPDPRRLPVFVGKGGVAASMSRRMDGAFPACVNPVALWEFKCYYYTTTFGSKISDAIYISDLDGFERRSVKAEIGRDVDLTLFVDAYGTWMDQGKSYLCRMVDMLNRGAVDEIVVGREVIDAIPRLVERWKSLL